jgi:hypothetical protein
MRRIRRNPLKNCKKYTKKWAESQESGRNQGWTGGEAWIVKGEKQDDDVIMVGKDVFCPKLDYSLH